MNAAWIWRRVGPGSGVLAVPLLVASMVLADPYDPALNPNPSQPASAIAEALVNNREAARLGAQLGLLGVFFLLWFVGYLGRMLRRSEPPDAWVSGVAVAGGIVLAATVLTSIMVTLAASELSSYGNDATVAKAYFVLGWNAAAVAAPSGASIVAAAAVAGFRFGVFPAWFNWLTTLMLLVIAVLTVAGTVGLAAAITLGWLMVLSATLIVRPEGWQTIEPH